MTVITDKNVAYFIIRNVTHSETSINETAEKKGLPHATQILVRRYF